MVLVALVGVPVVAALDCVVVCTGIGIGAIGCAAGKHFAVVLKICRLPRSASNWFCIYR